MYDNIERELKLLINEKVYNELLNSYDFHNPITQTNTYFDTENQDVKKNMVQSGFEQFKIKKYSH